MHRPDTDARGRAPDRDLGILPGHGRSGGRAKPWPQGGVIAFGNRPLPCALRTGSSLPMLGGRPADGADSPVGSETPRQPREARRLSKVNRGDWIRTSDLYVPNVAFLEAHRLRKTP